ncbi:MAG TPA: right-handed parallel beta-helix repeat-containing protein, partial [bacterium]|nr:right-handed parallel beta-helix repeat-containing protein [bacterium]
ETDPNGARINMGAYGDSAQASRSSLDSIYLVTPYGGAVGNEKWSGTHDLAWLPIGPGWGGGDTVSLEYTTDGSAYISIAAGLTWSDLTYPAWDTAAADDGSTYQIRVSDDADPAAVNSSSGRFIVDNTAPVNVGCLWPPDNTQGLDTDISLTGLNAQDALSGLHALPYYFRIDKDPSFSTADLQNSGWLSSPAWNLSGLDTRTWYYWQVKARDAADLPNESAFGADTDVPGSWWAFKTAAVFHVVDTQELRDVLDTEALEPGDRIYLDAGGDFSNVTAPITAWGTFTGTADLPIHIEGENGRPVISGDGLVSTLLDIQGSYFLVQGLDFTEAGGSGLTVSGNENTVNSCGAYANGSAGFEITGDHTRIQNTFSYINGYCGILLSGADRSEVYNNSSYDNGTYGISLAGATRN